MALTSHRTKPLLQQAASNAVPDASSSRVCEAVASSKMVIRWLLT